jgi:hypothetical protein
MGKRILLTSLLTIGQMIPIAAVNAQMAPGMMGNWLPAPEKLPPPKNAEWVQKLRGILVLEKTSYAHYTNDADHYNAAMPYRW